ncbi:MAG TPA: DUF6702 family protein, partial [Flavitalea sp.]|nr:DUF6702 family protein [Flavitalea sp.]
YNDQSHNIEISCKIFTDDLEQALGKKSGHPPHIGPTRDAAVNAEIAAYLSAHLGVSFDGKKVPMKFLGYELEKEAVWSYLEGPVTRAPSSAEIDNSILFDSFDQQINLVHITVKGERKSTKLVNPESRASLKF